MSFTPVMISCKQRLGEREQTLAQLKRVGIRPTVLEMACEPPSIEGNRYGAYHAADMASMDRAGLLFLEDDIDIDPKFPSFVEAAVAADEVVTFCIMRDRLYPKQYEEEQRRRIAEHGAAFSELVQLPMDTVQMRRGFHGSQAVYLPPLVVEMVLQDKLHFVNEDGSMKRLGSIAHGFDFWLKDNAHLFGGIYAAYPNPVQHRSKAPSMFGGRGVFMSNSFGLPSEERRP